MIKHVVSFDNLAQMKSQKGQDGNVILLSGKDQLGDGMLRAYYWKNDSTDDEDLTYMNVIAVTDQPIGRYMALSIKQIALPQGLLVFNGIKKELFVDSSISSASDCAINLTYDNTATGQAIFSSIRFDDSKALVNTTNMNDAVSSCRKSLVNNKVLTHLFWRGNSSILALGATLTGYRAAVAGTQVTFKVEGF